MRGQAARMQTVSCGGKDCPTSCLPGGYWPLFEGRRCNVFFLAGRVDTMLSKSAEAQLATEKKLRWEAGVTVWTPVLLAPAPGIHSSAGLRRSSRWRPLLPAPGWSPAPSRWAPWGSRSSSVVSTTWPSHGFSFSPPVLPLHEGELSPIRLTLSRCLLTKRKHRNFSMNLNLNLVKKPLLVLRKEGWGGLSFRGRLNGWSFLWTHPGGRRFLLWLCHYFWWVGGRKGHPWESGLGTQPSFPMGHGPEALVSHNAGISMQAWLCQGDWGVGRVQSP